MADVVANVLTRFKADPKPLKKALRDLTGEQKKFAKSQVEAMEKQNKALEASLAGWAKVAGGIAAATGAVVALKAGFDHLQKSEMLRSGSAAANMDGLRKASKGLITDMELMKFASDSLNGTFKLTQKEMETVLQGALAMRKSGKDLTQTLDRVGQAVREGNIEPLKELGIIIKDVEGDSMEGMKAAVEAMRLEYVKLGGNVDLSTDKLSRSGVTMTNAGDRFKDAMGRIAEALTPVVEGFAALLEIMVQVVNAAQESGLFGVRGSGGFVGTGFAAAANKALSARSAAGQAEAGRAMQAGALGRQLAGAGRGFMGSVGAAGKWLQSGGKFVGSKGGKKGKGFQNTVQQIDLSGGDLEGQLLMAEFEDDLAGISASADMEELNKQVAIAAKQGEAIAQQAQLQQEILVKTADILGKQAQEAAELTKGRSIISQMFGTPQEIDDQVAALELISGTFNTFANAAGQAFGAWIDGSASASEAFEKAIAQGLKGLAVEMGINALKETAAAIASAARYDYAGASMHGKAALAYAGGALAAGAAARSLYSGGGGPAAPSGSAAAGAGAGGTAILGRTGGGNDRALGSGDGQSDTAVILLDSSFSELSRRQRESLLRRRMRRAGARIQGDVIFDG